MKITHGSIYKQIHALPINNTPTLFSLSYWYRENANQKHLLITQILKKKNNY